MKKAVLSLALFVFALSLGVGASLMFPQKAAADQCIDIEGVIYVDSGEECALTKYRTGTIIRVYDGRLASSGLPCLFLYEYCGISPMVRPTNPNQNAD